MIRFSGAFVTVSTPLQRHLRTSEEDAVERRIKAGEWMRMGLK